MKNTQTIVITGGHVTPAIALIDALQKRDNLHIVFIGRTYAMEGSRTSSFEHQLITEKGIEFIPITAGRLQRRLTWQTIPSLVKIPVGMVQALLYCFRARPTLIVTFGGYVGLPVAVAGWMCRIPIITHEQTLVAGLANTIIAHLAKRVCVTYPETVDHFPQGKAIYTGLPIRQELFAPAKKSPYRIDTGKFPLLYITGGGTGAQSLNRLLFPLLPELLKKYSIVHQVGVPSFVQAQRVRESLSGEYRDRYIIASHIPLASVSWILEHAWVVLGRSGANTVTELAALGKVAIFVPLPWSGGGEQQKNADWLAAHGGAVVLTQTSLTPEILKKSIDDTWKNVTLLQKKAFAFAPTILRDGTIRLVTEIEKILPSTS